MVERIWEKLENVKMLSNVLYKNLKASTHIYTILTTARQQTLRASQSTNNILKTRKSDELNRGFFTKTYFN